MGTAPKVVAAVLTALLCAPIAFNCSPQVSRSHSFPSRFEWNSPALADFDGDSEVDRVSLRSNGSNKTIDIRFAALRTSRFSFITSSSAHGSLVGKDIDADGDFDLVWIGGREQGTAVVLINDGNGNFTEAKDNAPYAAEIDSLLNSSDPSEQPSFQAQNLTFTLTSSPFPDIAAAVAIRLADPSVPSASLDGLDAFAYQSAFLSDLRQRGPPLILS